MKPTEVFVSEVFSSGRLDLEAGKVEGKGEHLAVVWGERQTSNVVNTLVDNDIHAVFGVFVGCDLGGGELFGHFGGCLCGELVLRGKKVRRRDWRCG